ncbi:hypothetical protein [Paenibacillus pabuli]|uniref:MmyB family transcriptional regulator n=1 Tax=Paenibacillus pabuli TaxID=1472 RepID=UPI001FFE868C|nr:hypothetical protein [Paenibacillus pabuli]UPK42574.1 hypothetical protein KET34_25865 [Paenibacillus pabuli]
MTTSNQDRSAAELKRVLDTIERLRIQRQQNPVKIVSRIQNMKRFTQQELNDEACGTYKNLLTGRSRRLPDRQTLMDIANYLECTGEERNDLLLSAGYVPIPLPLSDRQLDRVLDQARSMMHQLPYPGMIVTDVLDIVGYNEAFCNLFGLSDFSFASNPPNMIDLHFNKDMPIRAASSFDEKSQARWESHGIVGIQAFKSHHPALFVDPKYARFHGLMEKYAELREFWNREAWTVEQDLNTAKYFLARQPCSAERRPIRYNQLHLAVTDQAYPRIEFFVPADESARQVFAAWGCAIDCSFKSRPYA